MEFKIEQKAKDKLDLMNKKYPSDLFFVMKGLRELKEKLNLSSNIKNIGDNVYRKRVGKWRILFTLDPKTLIVWIIEIEKDTKKDYKIWKDYIKSKRSIFN